MENPSPALPIPIKQPILNAVERSSPFSQEWVSLSKAEPIGLIQQAHYWKTQYAQLKQQYTGLEASQRKNDYGSGSLWSATLATALFSILKIQVLWGINPRHWLTAYLTACAENGGQSACRYHALASLGHGKRPA